MQRNLKRYDFFTRVASSVYETESIYVRTRITQMCEKKMESFRKESCVRGYYMYRELWEPRPLERTAGAWECNRRLCCICELLAGILANLGTNGGAVLCVRTTLRPFSQYLLHLFVHFRDCLRSETANL